MRVTRSFLPSVESQASGAADSLDHAPGSATFGDQGQARARPRGDAAVEVLRLEPAEP